MSRQSQKFLGNDGAKERGGVSYRICTRDGEDKMFKIISYDYIICNVIMQEKNLFYKKQINGRDGLTDKEIHKFSKFYGNSNRVHTSANEKNDAVVAIFHHYM